MRFRISPGTRGSSWIRFSRRCRAFPMSMFASIESSSFSSMQATRAFKYGSVWMYEATRKRRSPSRMIWMVLPETLILLTRRAATPTVDSSSMGGTSMEEDFCTTSPMMDSGSMSRIRLRFFFLTTWRLTTICGKTTVDASGMMGSSAGLRAHGEMLACDIPVELPIIPLASTVVFPQMVVNLQVVRKKNLNLIRDMEPESIIGLVVQKSSSIDVPPIEELSTVGVAARLVNKINVSGNTIQIILLGLRRFRVASYIQTEPYLKARVACIDEKEEDSMEANMLMGNALHLLENLIQLDPRVPGEILNLIKNNLSGPGNLADQIANHLNFELEEKKEILTTITPLDRLKVAIRLIEKSTGLAKAGQEIKEQTEDEIRKAQREFFLREQLKVIKKELGEESDTAATVRDLRDKLEKAGLPEEAKKEAEKELGRLG